MKIHKIVDFLNALDQWHRRERPISDLCLLLGDDTNELGRMLMLNAVADFNYQPLEGYSYQAVVNICLLYLAMRYAIKDDKKKK